jgi:PAS domain S-box-containing protein
VYQENNSNRLIGVHRSASPISDEGQGSNESPGKSCPAPTPADYFRTIVDGLPAMVTLMTPSGELEHGNRRMLEYFGKTLEELKSRTLGYSFHPDDRIEVLRRWQASVETGDPCDFEARLRRADGVYCWFHTRGFPLRDSEGRIVLWYLLQADIDDRKRAEALLSAEKGLLEMVACGNSLPTLLDALCRLVEQSAIGCFCSVVLVDPSGTRLEDGAAPSLPASFITSIVGRPINSESGPCAMAVHLNKQVIASDLKTETRWAQYAWSPMALTHGLQSCWSTPIPSCAGAVMGAFAIYYDEPKEPTARDQSLIGQFTHIASIAIERAQNDATLKRSEFFLAEAQRLSSTGSFSWRVDPDQNIWSEQLYRIFEFAQGTPITRQLIESRIHPEEAKWVYQVFEAARAVGRDLELEHRLLMPNGSVKYLRVVAHESQDQHGRLEYVGAVQDVTLRRLSEEALAKARSELARMARVTGLGALTASIAHEINQPLTGVITNADACLWMLEASTPDLGGARESAERIIRDGRRASDVIARLRALFGKKDAPKEPLDLTEATREVLALVGSEFHRSRVSVRTELAENLPPVAADRVQVQQVIVNLLLNASDAMAAIDDDARHVLIRTESDENDQVRLSVQDVGVGFEPDSAERLFEAFYTTKSEGMGIGLSVSRSIIESHGGRLWATPNAGPGSTFTFSIPCTSGTAMATGIRANTHNEHATKKPVLNSAARGAAPEPKRISDIGHALGPWGIT